ncbi:phosphatidylinositol N-acetylglucosaminyltransferase [Ascoidea rubescens DSM 1968]|uniref:Phosphatidylinositol N-acetylglucosaminyltransferase n=1 Tax=Ascoidea rubescens DSM 1968 TaxID=1344418 RepID=A0A1D2VJ26_9ASCO|nr:phosphatidylinositol N-acetylglucosaminyltransferase [Ascoidea rubescens DSM 1968]ODV61477.1 phosphatidylinositol N-acetylglucosaminyltransferase [Ascoidea rubescens DSM 1968]
MQRRRKDSFSLQFKSRARSRSIKNEWRKLLYLKQNYPDNYIDRALFLKSLKKNSTVVKYSYWNISNDFSLVSLHLCNVLMVYCFFVYSYSHNNALLSFCVTLATITIYLCFYRLNPNAFGFAADAIDHFKLFKSSVVIISFLLSLSPILKSLTNSISSDSIWALSFWLCILNILTNNYQFSNNTKDNNKNKDNYTYSIVAFNIQFSNLIVLASRLSSIIQVFCFILISIQFISIYPIFQHHLRIYNKSRPHKNSNKFLFVSYFILSTAFFFNLFKHSNSIWILIVFWFSLNFLILFIFPLYFIYLQNFKNELQGPWDPAKPIYQ